MPADDDDKVLGLESRQEVEEGTEKRLYLNRGRTATVSSSGADEILEIRSDGGMVELRVRLTEEGPVLQLEGARLEMTSTSDIDVKCKKFNVEAEEGVTVASKGDLMMTSEGEMDLKTPQDIRIRGKIVWLN